MASLFSRYGNFNNIFGDSDPFADPFFQRSIPDQQTSQQTTSNAASNDQVKQQPQQQASTAPSASANSASTGSSDHSSSGTSSASSTPRSTSSDNKQGKQSAVDSNTTASKSAASKKDGKQLSGNKQQQVSKQSNQSEDDKMIVDDAYYVLPRYSSGWFVDPFRINHVFSDMYNEMDRMLTDTAQVFNEVSSKLPALPSDGQNHVSSYSWSSSSTTLPGSDGKLITRTQHSESRNVDGLLEEKTSLKDSTGNERLVHRKMIDNKGIECIKDKSSKGQTRTTNNYTNLTAEQQQQFDKEFQERQSKLFNSTQTSSQQQQQLGGAEQQKRIKSN
jgi:hypothetical protein